MPRIVPDIAFVQCKTCKRTNEDEDGVLSKKSGSKFNGKLELGS
jgi:hypothetical protein